MVKTLYSILHRSLDLTDNLYPIRIIIVGCDDDSREVVQVFTNVYNAEN